jgi:hypothetical protein
MLFQADALRQVDAFLKAHDIPYAIIGGIANAVRGEPRTTHDADLKVLVRGMTIAQFRALAEAQFKPYHRPWLGQRASALVVSVEVAPDMLVDLLVAVLPYEEQAIQRAELINFEELLLPVCTAEDLIISTKPSPIGRKTGRTSTASCCANATSWTWLTSATG